MIDLKYLGVRLSEIVKYDPTRIYKKGIKCLFGKKLYVSNSDNNMNESPILGLKWDQII